MTGATVADALRKSIELLNEDGWIRGEMRTPGGFCSLGAIHQGALYVLGGDGVERNHKEFKHELAELRERTDRAVRNVIREKYDYGSIVFWNDNIRRTREEVLGVFHEALERAES